ncbi:MAG: NTP transferase domain-containing protein [Euryarchaeota archaeon]|nr:NTP transferase domain-containing protein [Euryarchaeota archaeon]
MASRKAPGKKSGVVGLVLCGGMGKRLRPLTDQVPKPLVEIQKGYTILDRQLLEFLHAGISRVVLLTGHLGDKIEARYGRRWRGLSIDYNVEEEPRGTLYAIREGMARAGTDAVVRNGDVVADVNLKKMVEVYRRSGRPALMYVTRMRSPYGLVDLEGERIRRFREKPLLEHYINGGVYCLSPGISFNGYEGGDIEKTLFPTLAESGRLGAYQEEGFWMAIDTLKDLEEVRKEYSNREDKPWGYEKVLVSTDKYLTKELYIREGYRTSVHYHKEKDETLYVVHGTLVVEFEGGKKKTFSKNDKFRITPGMVHSLIAQENVLLQEFSTPHLHDTVRKKDFYGRP